MSGTQVSSFAPANTLFNLPQVYQAAQQYQQNQQTLGSNEIEMAARAAQGLLALPEDQRATAWGPAVLQLRQQGFAKNADPNVYPGEARLKQIAMLGTPSSKQAEWNYNTGVNQAGLGPPPAAPAATTSAPVTGTGTGTTAAQTVEPDALTRAQAVRDGLIKRGLDPETATAFSANALHESSANPNTGAGDAGASHWLFQWRDARYDLGKRLYGAAPTLDQQLDYVIQELNTTEGAALDRINAAQGPEAKAAAISQYYLRPKDVEGEQTRRSATARQLVSQWGGAGQPATTYVGDSLVEPGGVGGQTGRGVRGASPDAVLARLRDPNTTSDTQIRGKNIVLSSGASNDPEHAQLLASQLQTLKDRGAGAVTVLGVGPGVKNADVVNAQLQQIAERNGARFVALPADQMGKDGIHPTKEGYAALQAQVQAAPAPAAPGGPQQPGPYKVAGPVVAPPTGAPGAPAGPPPNGLAPGAPGAPATAAAAAPVAQNQVGPPVAASPPAPPRLPTLDADNLTDNDRRTLAGLVRENPAEFTRAKTAMQARNIAQQNAAADNYRQDLAAYQTQAEREYQRLRNSGADQRAIEEAGRQAQAAKDAHEKAVRDAAEAEKAAARPVRSTGIDAEHESALHELAPKIRAGTATELERGLYTSAYYALQQSGGQSGTMTDPNDASRQIPYSTTRRLAPELPEPPGGALPQVISQPGAGKKDQMTNEQTQAAGFADRVHNDLPIITDTSPAAMSRWQVLLGKAPLGNSLVSTEFQLHMQAERDFINAILRRESGAAIQPSEFDSARQQYIPQPGDSKEVLAQKEKNRETVLSGLVRAAGAAYKPPLSSFDKK